MSSKKRGFNQLQPLDLAAKFRSKSDVHVYLTEKLQYYLPSSRCYNKDFVKKVFIGEKLLFRINQINYILVPIYEELSVKKILDMVKNESEIISYLPDELLTKKIPEREYFFNILNTVYPGFLQNLISHASHVRIEGEGDKQAEQVILATDEWLQELKSVPFFSKKNGRTLHLLKNSSKPLGAIRKKKKYNVIGDFAEFREAKAIAGQPISIVPQSAVKEQESDYSQSQSQIDGDMK